jgi:hypothetical protein
VSQPPNDQPPPAGQSGDQPTYGQPTYGQPTYGQPTYGSPGQQYPDPHQQQQQYGQSPGWSQPTAAQYGTDIRQTEAGYAQMYGQKQRTGMAIAALVLGILGLLASPWPFGSYVAVLLSVLAVIFGIVAVRRPIGKGMAIAGLILGGLALIISIIASIFWTGVIGDVLEITQQCIDDTGTDQGSAFRQCVDQRSRNYNPFD